MVCSSGENGVRGDASGTHSSPSCSSYSSYSSSHSGRVADGDAAANEGGVAGVEDGVRETAEEGDGEGAVELSVEACSTDQVQTQPVVSRSALMTCQLHAPNTWDP